MKIKLSERYPPKAGPGRHMNICIYLFHEYIYFVILLYYFIIYYSCTSIKLFVVILNYIFNWVESTLQKFIFEFLVGISTVCMLYLILFLKLWSYAQTNHWCRIGMKAKFSNNKLRRQSLSAPNWSKCFYYYYYYLITPVIINVEVAIPKPHWTSVMSEMIFG